MIRRFGFTSSVIAFLLIAVATPGAAQSQQSGAVTVSQAVQEAVQKNFNLLAERYNVSVTDAQIVTARMRPVLMMIVVGMLGMIPAARATGIGSDVQRPLATVVVGGPLSTLFLTLIALLSLYYLMNRRREEPHDESRVPIPDELPADSVDHTKKDTEEVLAD